MLRRSISTLLALCGLAATVAYGADVLTDSTQGFFKYPYRLYVPEETAPSGGYPLIVHLHGNGEPFRYYSLPGSADDYNNAHVVPDYFPDSSPRDLLDHVIDGSNMAHRAIVVAPQFLKRWTDGDGPSFGYHQWAHEPERLVALIDYLRSVLPIDGTRIYIEGLSAGATGTMYALAERPELFAAAMPMSGRDASTGVSASAEPDIPGIADLYGSGGFDAVAGKPIWIFHGSQDTLIFPFEGRTLRNALNTTTGDDSLRYTEYAQGHGDWNEILADNPTFTQNYVPDTVASINPMSIPAMPATSAGIYDWMFSKTNPSAPSLLPAPSTGQIFLLDFGMPNADEIDIYETPAPDTYPTYQTVVDSVPRTWNTIAWSDDLAYALTTPHANITDALHTFGLTSTTGTRTRASLRVMDPLTGRGSEGVSGANVFNYPESAQLDYWFVDGATTGRLRLEQLVPGAMHRLRLYATRLDDTVPRIALYSVTGATGTTTATLDPIANLDDAADFPAIVANASGEILIEMDAETVTPSFFALLSVAEVEVIAGPLYTAWATGTPNNLGGADALPSADPDNDGVSNLMEYATGRDPLIAETAAVATIEHDTLNGRLLLTYPKAIATGVAYEAETSTDLQTWVTTDVDQEFATNGNLTTAAVVLTGEPRRFLRLRVTLVE